MNHLVYGAVASLIVAVIIFFINSNRSTHAHIYRKIDAIEKDIGDKLDEMEKTIANIDKAVAVLSTKLNGKRSD